MSSTSHEYKDPLVKYLVVFVTLLLLLGVTVLAYLFDFGEHFGQNWGWLNTLVALIIASIKSAMVMLIFMHLAHSTRLTWAISVVGFLFLCIMITFTFSDYLTRSSITEMVSGPKQTTANIVAAQGSVAEHQTPMP